MTKRSRRQHPPTKTIAVWAEAENLVTLQLFGSELGHPPYAVQVPAHEIVGVEAGPRKGSLVTFSEAASKILQDNGLVKRVAPRHDNWEPLNPHQYICPMRRRDLGSILQNLPRTAVAALVV